MVRSDRRTGAEIAYVVDSDFAKYLGFDPIKSAPTRGFALMDYPRFLWGRAGVPYDAILLDKLDQRRDYKVYVFFLTIGLDAAQTEMIDNVVKRGGKTAIFLWAAGFVDREGMFSDRAMSDLVGMKITASTAPRSWRMTPSEWFTSQAGIAEGTPMGTLANNEPCEPLADRNTYAPSFTVSDQSVQTIAHYEGTSDVAIAVKRHRDWSSIYCASMNLVPSVVRYALTQAGGFLYTDTDDVCYINNSFIGLHTKKTGAIRVNVPESGPLYDVYNDKELKASSSFNIPVKELQSYLFYRGTKEAWDALEMAE
jgi:hypothetical protein